MGQSGPIGGVLSWDGRVNALGRRNPCIIVRPSGLSRARD
jgi:hypothetical protein